MEISINQHLSKLIKLRIKEVLNLPNKDAPQQKNNLPGKCYYCSSKKKKNNRRTKYSCQKCGKFMCLEYCLMMCQDCNNGNEIGTE
ncbi:hypothetical protein NQ314_017159 [Rhamnusium bicolor]|uniref:PiggyBac transposable element-derived protein 4 C-terminal zinc-ribbon domain-containing protein n=1 Tax=Rhamnusium bicolor TaxID=1586634 RepID=A0AAV8WU14_9CUCU|nr:hypothetical protein NQ314_017159 [Rhamnusium bicolor]